MKELSLGPMLINYNKPPYYEAHLLFSEFLDIDECEESGLCGHNARCVNTEGSYMCYCNDGYKLETGEHSFHQDGNVVSCKGENLWMLFLIADKITCCTTVWCQFWRVLLQGSKPFPGICLLYVLLCFFFSSSFIPFVPMMSGSQSQHQIFLQVLSSVSDVQGQRSLIML